MKRKGYYLCSLLVMIFVFLSCRDEEQDCTQAMQDIQNQLKENDLLKSVSQEREQCVLLFESNKIIFPQELIQSVDVDAENWKTTLTFANGSTYVIPTLGASIDIEFYSQSFRLQSIIGQCSCKITCIGTH